MCLEDTGYSGLLRCHPHIRLRWCLSHVKGHSSHALLRGLDGGHSGEEMINDVWCGSLNPYLWRNLGEQA